MIRTKFLFVALLLFATLAHGQIYSPSNGSTIQTTSQFSWYSDWNNSYYVMFGTNGCYSSDYGANWWNATTITLGLPSNFVGNIWATIYWYPNNGTYDLTSTCYNYNVGGQLGSVSITSPINGSKLSVPNQVFYVTSTTYPFYVTTGWSGPGSSELGYNVQMYGNFYYSQGLPMSGDHPYTYVRTCVTGVCKDQQFANVDAPASTAVGLPEVSTGSATDDYTGMTVQDPTLDSPGAILYSVTSEGTQMYSGSSVYTTDTFTTTIGGLQPGSTVFVTVYPTDTDTTGNGLPGDTNWCGVVAAYPPYSPVMTYCGNFPNPTGYADSNGFFSMSGYFNGMRATRWTEKWQGTGVDGNAVTLYNPYFVVSPGGAPPTVADPAESMPLASGKARVIRRGDKVKTSISSEHKGSGDKHTYDFFVDTRNLSKIRVGDDAGYADFSVLNRDIGMADGWLSTGFGWVAQPDAKRSPRSHFTITTDWLPGPVSIMLQDSQTDQTFDGQTSEENIKLATVLGIERNSLRRTVIGPAIPPGTTNEALRGLIKGWISLQNLGFLQPLAKDGVDLKTELLRLEPQTSMQKKIVDCLAAAIQ